MSTSEPTATPADNLGAEAALIAEIWARSDAALIAANKAWRRSDIYSLDPGITAALKTLFLNTYEQAYIDGRATQADRLEALTARVDELEARLASQNREHQKTGQRAMKAEVTLAKVAELHVKTTRYSLCEDASFTTEAEMREYYDTEDLESYDGSLNFDVCVECARAEKETHQDYDEWSYLASIWPCRTRAILDGNGGDDL